MLPLSTILVLTGSVPCDVSGQAAVHKVVAGNEILYFVMVIVYIYYYDGIAFVSFQSHSVVRC